MEAKKRLEKLKIGETLKDKLDEFNVIRVHGGWIYSKEKVSSSGYAVTSVFVPWNKAPENKTHKVVREMI